MITDEIKDLMHAQPFHPVRIVIGDNQAFIVSHMDYLMISPDRQTVHFYDETGHFKILNAQQIKYVAPAKVRPPKKR